MRNTDFPKLSSLTESLASGVKTGSFFFILFTILNGLANVCQGAIAGFSRFVWRQIRKYTRGQTTTHSECKNTGNVTNIPANEANYRVPAGLNLAIILEYERMIKDKKARGQ